MNVDDIKATIATLRQEPERRETIQHYTGNRTLQELKTIVGRKRSYYKVLKQLQNLFHDDLELEVWALLLAAADYRKNRPHSARVLAAVEAEREERRKRNRYRGLTIEQKIRRDYDEIMAYKKSGLTWQEVRTKLKNKSAYRREKIHPDTLRHICKKIEREI